jgi:thymidylate synthase
MQAYKDIIKNVLDNGTHKPNRTGIDTISVTGTQFRHDMRTGFPLVTLKKTPFKLICVELEGFIKGITDKKWYEDNGCFIWSEWANPTIAPYGHDEESKRIMKETRDLGPIYGYQLRNFGKPYTPIPQIISLPKPESLKRLRHSLLEVYYHSKYGEYVILKKYKLNENKSRSYRYDVVFLKTNFEVKGITEYRLKNEQFTDFYFPTVAGVACIGNKEELKNNPYSNKLRTVWNSMINRCYNEKDPNYYNYGAKGVYVSNDWLVFSNFVKDVQELKNWDYKILNQHQWKHFSLDKDKYSPADKKYYSKETCFWATPEEQSLNTSQFIRIIGRNLETNDIITLNNMKYDAKKFGLNPNGIIKNINGHTKSYKGYVFKREDKKQIYFDQLENIVKTLKDNPTCRRMVASYWNKNQADEMALESCHYNWQVVSDGKNIDLVFNMRSVDVMLGMPFDIAHYGMMLELLARESGMTARWLVGNFADTHIYENHLDGAREAMNREPLPLPTIDIPGFTSIFEWTYQQRKLNGYKSYDKISMEVAV